MIDLPSAENDAEISAKFRSGVLTIVVPKSSKASRPRKIDIRLES